MAIDYNSMTKEDLIALVQRLQAKEDLGLVLDEERTREVFEQEAENVYPVLTDVPELATTGNSEVKNHPAPRCGAHPFDLRPDELADRLDEMVDVVWTSLQSNFLAVPKGDGYVTYERFAKAYDSLRVATDTFHAWTEANVYRAFEQDPLSLVVVRAILGVSPPEWAYLTKARFGMDISQNTARSLDRTARGTAPHFGARSIEAVKTMFATAVEQTSNAAPSVSTKMIHRFAKVDTMDGLDSLQYVANAGTPYSVLLYERFLGRPFASHRDAVSEIVGDFMETAVEEVFTRSRIPVRKTKRAEKVPGFDQAPDFIYPDEWRPAVVIEAKITEDDGTARDKITRIQHLAELSLRRNDPFQVVACIDGRGFGERREDMKKLLLATKGKVFTLDTVQYLTDALGLRPPAA